MADPAPESADADKQRSWEAAEAEKRRVWEAAEAEKKRKVDLWAKHEDIAMHFNDLTMRLRLQALGGVGASALVAGSILTHEGKIDLKHLGPFLIAMAFVWGAVFALDHFYYQALLKAAVVSIVALEKSIAEPSVTLSTKIKSEVRDGQAARVGFYGIIFALLLGGGVWLLFDRDLALLSVGGVFGAGVLLYAFASLIRYCRKKNAPESAANATK